MTVRPWWRDGQLIDLPGALVSVGEEAGLVLCEREAVHRQARARVGLNGASMGPVGGSEIVPGNRSEAGSGV